MSKFSEYKQKVFNDEKRALDPVLSIPYRYVSLPLSFLIRNSGITPNQITGFQILVGLAACFYLYLEQTGSAFLISVLVLHFAYVLDCVDGELARFRNQQSIQGVFFDKYAHAITMSAIFLAYGSYFGGQEATAWRVAVVVVSWLAAFSSFMPAYRLVVTVAESFFRKEGIEQYEMANYQEDKSGRGDEVHGADSSSGPASLVKKLKGFMDGGGEKLPLFRLVNELFRHATYLAILTVILILEMFSVPSIAIILIWVGLCLAVTGKEAAFLALVLRSGLIQDRYKLYQEKVAK